MNYPFENDLKLADQTLKQGGLILYPTDTIWGIGCDATSAEAVNKVYALKQRQDNKALVVLLASEKDIYKYITEPPPDIFNYLENEKGPLTVIYDGATGVADNLKAADGSVAIRIVKDDFCKMLIKKFGRPVVSTSANISGMRSAENFNDIVSEIKTGVDYIVQHRQNEIKNQKPSKIIKWNRDGTITTIRS